MSQISLPSIIKKQRVPSSSKHAMKLELLQLVLFVFFTKIVEIVAY